MTQEGDSRGGIWTQKTTWKARVSLRSIASKECRGKRAQGGSRPGVRSSRCQGPLKRCLVFSFRLFPNPRYAPSFSILPKPAVNSSSLSSLVLSLPWGNNEGWRPEWRQEFGLNLHGKRIWKRIDKCICTTESLRCAAETNTAVLINCATI